MNKLNACAGDRGLHKISSQGFLERLRIAMEASNSTFDVGLFDTRDLPDTVQHPLHSCDTLLGICFIH
jgi:hypothetical protein